MWFIQVSINLTVTHNVIIIICNHVLDHVDLLQSLSSAFCVSPDFCDFYYIQVSKGK
jgi:hypothetical protein